jgi:hypothetical protein
LQTQKGSPCPKRSSKNHRPASSRWPLLYSPLSQTYHPVCLKIFGQSQWSTPNRQTGRPPPSQSSAHFPTSPSTENIRRGSDSKRRRVCRHLPPMESHRSSRRSEIRARKAQKRPGCRFADLPILLLMDEFVKEQSIRERLVRDHNVRERDRSHSRLIGQVRRSQTLQHRIKLRVRDSFPLPRKGIPEKVGMLISGPRRTGFIDATTSSTWRW